MDYPKSVPNVGLVNGKFVDENTTTGQVGSLIPASWGNAVTDELLNVIRASGKSAVENDNGQLLVAIKAIVRDAVPPENIRTTLAQYGITDAYTKSQNDSLLAGKATKASSLAGYGITDAYTKSQVDAVVNVQATEAARGGVRVATIGEVIAGGDDSTVVTPRKARWGFGLSLGETGFIALPSWLGRFIIQWGATTTGNVTFPLQFGLVSYLDLKINNFNSSYAASGTYTNTETLSTTGFRVKSAPPAGAHLKWIAFGN